MRSAAFFDLDRTLLRSASGPVYSAAMRDLGLVSRSLPMETVLFGVYNRFGETLPSIALARQAVMVAKGRPVGAFGEAADRAADQLYASMTPFAHDLLEENRAQGRPIVLATTTPEHLVRPLAERVGADDVIATRYAVDANGRYDGSLDGPFVWCRGKLEAVRRWAADHDVDLSESRAYSDSVYDLPLLTAVGHPTAVNPDVRLLAVAAARRWPVRHVDVSPGVAKIPVLDAEVQRVVLMLTRPELFPYARFDLDGAGHIPAAGPAVVVANHRSYFDLAAMAMVIRQSGRTARFMAKREIFDTPVVGAVARAVGGIQVDRQQDGGTSFAAAARALAAGEVVGVMPQGTIPRGRAFFEPRLEGHLGAARLAAMTRAPVIPVALWGTEKVWPRSSRGPHVLNVTHPPTVRIRVGPPVELTYRSAPRDTRRILDAVADLLPPEAHERRIPTDEELKATFPRGVVPDA